MFLRYNLFTFVWAVVIFLLILMPGQQMPQMGDLFSIDKIAHCGVFAILCFLMIVGFAKQNRVACLKRSAIIYGACISFGYATALELSQYFVEDRTMDVLDMFFNTSGVVIGLLTFLSVYKLSFR